MPKDNNQQPTTPPPTTSGDDQSPIFMEETLPPMPQEDKPQNETEQLIDNVPETQPIQTPTPTENSGSASPQDENIMPPIVTTNNKKKFAGGKMIATILGLFLLIGGVGSGIFLVNQNQNIKEKAGGVTCSDLTNNNDCVSYGDCEWNPNFEKECDDSNCVATGGNYTLGCSPSAITPGYCKGPQGCSDLDELECRGVCTWVEATAPKCIGTIKGECRQKTSVPNECEDQGGTCRKSSCNANETKVSQTCVAGSQDICCKIKPTSTPTTPPVNECEGAGGTCKNGTVCTSDENKLSLTCLPGSNKICCKSKSTTDPLCATEIKCEVGDTTCSVGKLFSSTCYVNHYICDDEQATCNTLAPNGGGLQSASLTTTCGTEQIDLYCKACNMTVDVGICNGVNCQKYISRRNPSCGPTTPPTNPPGTTSCTNIKAYTEDWVLISQTNLSKLKTGDKTNFCVSGTTSSGSFDKARVTINGSLKPETIRKRPNTNDFCYLYTIPSGTKTFNITSQIHHKELNQWK